LAARFAIGCFVKNPLILIHAKERAIIVVYGYRSPRILVEKEMPADGGESYKK
jgi:hypothetical protein